MNSFRGDGEEPIGLVDHDVDFPIRARQVDADVFEPYDEFYRRTYADLMVLARALVGSAAEDVAQEVMLETTTGPRVNMASRYTFVDLGSSRVMAVWSWAFGNRWETVEAADELIRRVEIRSRGAGTPPAP